MRPEQIPYGVKDFKRIRLEDFYYVDKTAFIRRLEARANFLCFVRPRRFGKSLLCETLRCYYDVAEKGNFDRLFGGLDIGRDPTANASRYFVLSLDFSQVNVCTGKTWADKFGAYMDQQLDAFITEHEAFVGDMPDIKAVRHRPGAAEKFSAVVAAARLLGLGVYVIVDEYDNFTNELVVSRRDVEYDAICGHDGDGAGRESFFKAFFKSFKAGLADGTVGRTYFTGVLPITLDDLSSGFNVGTVVNLNPDLLGMVGFTQAQVDRYVDEIYADRGFDRSNYRDVLADLKAFYDGYRFLPGAEPLYNATICNWYLFNLVSNRGVQPDLVIDANVRMDVVWIRRLAGGTANALARVQAYVERGEGEAASRGGLAAKFGRAKFFSKDFFPYALYYLGLLTFESPFRLGIPNLTIRNMFVDYYDELSAFKNADEARRHFGKAAEDLALNGGTWRGLFEAYWQHFVKARIPAQAFDKMNENFFRTTFASRTWDYLPMYYSIETEYNTPEGRCDFLAVPKPGFAKPACLIEFKYFTNAEAAREKILGRATPDAETVAQAKRYRDALPRRPGWNHPVETYVVEVCGNRGYNWFAVGGDADCLQAKKEEREVS